MASHKKHAQPTTFALPGKSQMVKIVATVAAVGLLATGGIVSHNLYATAEKSPAKQVTAYSVTDSIEASRGNAREALSGDTSYVTVKINGKTRVVPGMHFTDVKSVLDAGDITLDTEDTVSPSLDTKVNENTVIKIERAGASVEVSDTDIAFNTVKKETSSLRQGHVFQYDQLLREEGSDRQGDPRRHRLLVHAVRGRSVDRHHRAGWRNAAVGSRLSAVQRLFRGRFHRDRVHHFPRIRLECFRHEPVFRCLRPAASSARFEDGERRR